MTPGREKASDARATGLALIVDDEPGILSTLSGVLADQGHRTVTTSSGIEALQLYLTERPDVVFLDVWLPDRDGLETLAALRDADPGATVVLMSGHGTTSTAVRAIKMGAFDYLEKPLSYAQAVEAMAAALASRRSTNRADAGESGRAQDEPLLAADSHRRGGWGDRNLDFLPAVRARTSGTLHSRSRRGAAHDRAQHRDLRPGTSFGRPHRDGAPAAASEQRDPLRVARRPRASIPAHVSAVGETEYATTLGNGIATIKTVEHLLSALHAYGVTNLLIKVHGEIPVLDGSAVDFCRTLEQIGLVDQGEAASGSGDRPGLRSRRKRREAPAHRRQAGLDATRTGISTDRPEELAALLRRHAADVDLIVTTGGVSKGAYEVVRQAMDGHASSSVPVAMQPGGPQGIGTVRRRALPRLPR